MTPTRTFVVAALAAVGLLPASADQAQAQYYGAVVKNNLKITVAFEYRVNGGAWIVHTLKPGASVAFSQTNAWIQKNKKYEVDVRFDNRMSDGKYTPTVQRLVMWGCSEVRYGWGQAFINVNDGKDVMLHR